MAAEPPRTLVIAPTMQTEPTITQKGSVNLGSTCYLNSIVQCILATRWWGGVVNEKCHASAFVNALRQDIHESKNKPHLVLTQTARWAREKTGGGAQCTNEVLYAALSEMETELSDTYTIGITSAMTCSECDRAQRTKDTWAMLTLNYAATYRDATNTQFQQTIDDYKCRSQCAACYTYCKACRDVGCTECRDKYCAQCTPGCYANGASGKQSVMVTRIPTDLLIVHVAKHENPMAPMTGIPRTLFDDYDLVAVSIATGGHHNAVVKNGDRWIFIDDSSRSVLQTPDDMISRASMFFYEKNGSYTGDLQHGHV